MSAILAKKLGMTQVFQDDGSVARVTVLHLMDRLMERQLDVQAAAMLQHAVEAMGIEVILNADTAEIGGSGRVDGVTLKDGRTIDRLLYVLIRP